MKHQIVKPVVDEAVIEACCVDNIILPLGYLSILRSMCWAGTDEGLWHVGSLSC